MRSFISICHGKCATRYRAWGLVVSMARRPSGNAGEIARRGSRGRRKREGNRRVAGDGVERKPSSSPIQLERPRWSGESVTILLQASANGLHQGKTVFQQPDSFLQLLAQPPPVPPAVSPRPIFLGYFYTVSSRCLSGKRTVEEEERRWMTFVRGSSRPADRVRWRG